MPVCTNDISLITHGAVEVRQVLSESPWFDVYFFSEHWFGTLSFAEAIRATTSFVEMLSVHPLKAS